MALHGDLDQSARTAALDAFRSGEAKLLIASDVAARGLDIPDVSHVFNFDVPHHADDYVHRIGRTGRAGKTGTAITIVGPGDGKAVAEIEKLIGQSIPWADALPVEAAQADAAAPAEAHTTLANRAAKVAAVAAAVAAATSSANAATAVAVPRANNIAKPRDSSAYARSQPDRAGHRANRVSPPPSRGSKRPGTDRRRPGRAIRPNRAAASHLPAFLLRPVRGKA